MYKDFETQTSYSYLKQVIGELDEPICILGGWAVFFYVKDKFQSTQGRPYLGSRDIDLGFSMSTKAKKEVLKKSISILEKKLKFVPQGFRYFKEIHIETGKEIKEGENVLPHNRFPMYVDLIVDKIPPGFKEEFGFQPIDEPLLQKAFGKGNSTILTEFDKKLLLPKTELMIAMKVNSLPDRDKEHKRIKDLCDIFALAWYTDLNFGKLNLNEFTTSDKLSKCFSAIGQNDFERAAELLGNDKEEVKRVFREVCSR